MKYQSKGKTISKSLYHKDLWIVEQNGSWYSIAMTDEQMLKQNPPNMHLNLKAPNKLSTQAYEYIGPKQEINI